MKKLIIITLLFYSTILLAETQQYQSPMSIYQDNYFITGDSNDQTKFQVSAKYALLYPSNIGLFLGYTQKCLWKTYDKSSPFYETNYQPEVFYQSQSFWYIDYIQVSPIEHLSNGRDGEASRGMNMFYAKTQLSYGDIYNIGFSLKGFGYFNVSKNNKDINNYKGFYEADLFFKIKSDNVKQLDKDELHFKFGSSLDKGWFCIEGQFRLITSIIQPKFFIQYYYGYNQWLIDYNKKEQSVRIGLTF
jgi:phospholipase A1/A2